MATPVKPLFRKQCSFDMSQHHRAADLMPGMWSICVKILKPAMYGIAVLSLSTVASAQDIAKGAGLFQQRCAICHAVVAGKKGSLGPNLFNIVGRKAAGQTDFNYSPAMKQMSVTWSKTMLDTFLAAPNKLVPGTRMPVAVPLAPQRADIIEYLAKMNTK